MENNTLILASPVGSQSRKRGQRINQTTDGSVQTRVPLRDKTNFNTDAHAQGSGSGQSASISSILVVQDENTMPSTTSAPSQVAASDPEVSQMTVSLPALSHVTNSVPAEDVQSRTSCFVLPLRACFLSLTTGISPLEISTNSCCIAGYNASLFLGLSEQPQQVQLIVNPDYLRGSAFVTEQKRADLVNNLLLFGQRNKSAPSTLHRACFLVDRYLSALHTPMFHQNFEVLPLDGEQLDLQTPDGLLIVACTAIWMAYKLEGNQENFDFRWFDVGPAAGEQGPLLLALLQENIAACEARINHALGPDIFAPTSLDYLSKLVPIADFSRSVDKLVALCICERAIFEYEMLQFLPHMIATSAVYITRLLAQQTREREEVSKKTAGAGAGATPAATTAFAGSAAPAAPSAKGRRKRTLSDASVSTPATSAKKGRSEGAKKGPLSARKGSCSTTASAPASAPAPAASSSSSKGKKKQIPEIEPEKVWTAALQNFSGCSEADMVGCVKALLHMFSQEATNHARARAHGVLEGSELGFSYLALLSALQSKLLLTTTTGADSSPESILYLSYLPGILEHFAKSVVQEASTAAASTSVAGLASAVTDSTTTSASAASTAKDTRTVATEVEAPPPSARIESVDVDHLKESLSYADESPGTPTPMHQGNILEPVGVMPDLRKRKLEPQESQELVARPLRNQLSHAFQDISQFQMFQQQRHHQVATSSSSSSSSSSATAGASMVPLEEGCEQQEPHYLDVLIEEVSNDLYPGGWALSFSQSTGQGSRTEMDCSVEDLTADSAPKQPQERKQVQEKVQDQEQEQVNGSYCACQCDSPQSPSMDRGDNFSGDIDAPAPFTGSTTVSAYRPLPWSIHDGTAIRSTATLTSFCSTAHLPDQCHTAPAKEVHSASSSTQDGYAYRSVEESYLLGMGTGGTATAILNRATGAMHITDFDNDTDNGPCKLQGRKVNCRLSFGEGTQEYEEHEENHERETSVSRKAAPQQPRVVTLPEHLQDMFQLYPLSAPLQIDVSAVDDRAVPVVPAAVSKLASSSSCNLNNPPAPPVPPVPPPQQHSILDVAIAQGGQLDVQFNATFYRYRAVYEKLVLLPPRPSPLP